MKYYVAIRLIMSAKNTGPPGVSLSLTCVVSPSFLPLPSAASLVESAAPEVVGDDDVGDGVEDELDVLRVGGARHVAVDLLRRRLVLRLELRLDVRRGLAVLLRTCGWV